MSDAMAEDWTLVNRSIARTGQGIVYVEARLRDESRDVYAGPEASTYPEHCFFLNPSVNFAAFELEASCHPRDATKIPQTTVHQTHITASNLYHSSITVSRYALILKTL